MKMLPNQWALYALYQLIRHKRGGELTDFGENYRSTLFFTENKLNNLLCVG